MREVGPNVNEKVDEYIGVWSARNLKRSQVRDVAKAQIDSKVGLVTITTIRQEVGTKCGT